MTRRVTRSVGTHPKHYLLPTGVFRSCGEAAPLKTIEDPLTVQEQGASALKCFASAYTTTVDFEPLMYKTDLKIKTYTLSNSGEKKIFLSEQIHGFDEKKISKTKLYRIKCAEGETPKQGSVVAYDKNRDRLEKLILKQRLAGIPSVYLDSASDLTESESEDLRKLELSRVSDKSEKILAIKLQKLSEQHKCDMESLFENEAEFDDDIYIEGGHGAAEFEQNLQHENNLIMFDEAGLTVSDVLLMIFGYCLRFNATFEGKKALIELVKRLAGPKFEQWNDDQLRTHESHLMDMQKVINCQHRDIRGVKGLSILATDMPHFDSIWGFPVDVMHGILLGPVKQLWEAWTTPGSSYYLNHAKRKAINERIRNIRVPHEIHRLPRSTSEISKWKASERLYWALYYSFPCLYGILADRPLKSFMLLIRSLYTLLKTEITEAELRSTEYDLLQFVGECQILYGTSAMTFNVHSLLHVVQSVKKSGPLWATSAFPFENGIYLCKKWLNGPRIVSIQLSTKWLQSNLNVEKCNVELLGASDDPQDYDKYLISLVVNNLNAKPKLFSRCKFKNAIFHGTSYSRRTRNDDSIVMLNCNKIIQIRLFVHVNGKYFVIAAPLTTTPVTSPIKLPHMAEILEVGNDFQMYDIDAIKRKLDNRDNNRKKIDNERSKSVTSNKVTKKDSPCERGIKKNIVIDKENDDVRKGITPLPKKGMDIKSNENTTKRELDDTSLPSSIKKPRIIETMIIKSASPKLLERKSNALITGTQRPSIKPANDPTLDRTLEDLRKQYAAEKKKVKQLNTALELVKVENDNLKAMNVEMTGLNIELQKTVISYVKQLTEGDNNAVLLNPQENIINAVPSVGYVRQHDKKIHLGEGVWIEKGQYDLCTYHAKNSYQLFVKDLALSVFGPEVLKNSSVTGSASRKNPNKPAFPRLDPVKLTAIHSKIIIMRIQVENEHHTYGS
ncbi:PREDICTED: uncharacterized protein LOC105450146 [Wasmannia auropunctata]|uniref:uncharacterized protein LOC105450146 n=1 Tax=Wasmannia auropunctata TaxID=64793 RepID=UPI0005EE1FA9|nr:PREDICTED: uncharacterized protein LOC105450146 [Wasmannia auropunctata]